MNIIIDTITFAIGIFIGIKLYQYILKKYQKKLEDKTKTLCDLIFVDVYKNIISGNAYFKDRINDKITLITKLPTFNYEPVSIIYQLGTIDFAIAYNDEIKYTSQYVNPELLTAIKNSVISIFYNNIKDVVEMFDNNSPFHMIISKSIFQNTLHMSYDKYQSRENMMNNLQMQQLNQTDIGITQNPFEKLSFLKDNLEEKKEIEKFYINDVLDKINKFGIKSLTQQELNFLKSI